jgi:hypothetical protein
LVGLLLPEAVTTPCAQLLSIHNRVLGLLLLARCLHRVLVVAMFLRAMSRGRQGLRNLFNVFIVRNWPGALFTTLVFVSFPLVPMMLSDVVFYTAVVVWVVMPLAGPLMTDLTRAGLAVLRTFRRG